MKWIKDCIDSLQNSNYPTDIIVIDNGSTDQTTQFIKDNYTNIKLIINQENFGFGKANNIGISHGIRLNYDYFFLLNQDAWIFENTLQNLLHNMETNPDYGIISPIQLQKNLEVESIFKSYIKKHKALLKPFEKNKILDNKVLTTDFTNAAMWFISKECITKTGGFSPLFYHYGEDADFINRTKYHGFKNGVSTNAFGIHDRYSKPKLSVKEYNKKKQHPGPWPLKYFLILSNINISFPLSLIKSLQLFYTSLFKHIIKLNWFSVKYDFIVIYKVLKKTIYIYRLRKKLKNSQSLFLD